MRDILVAESYLRLMKFTLEINGLFYNIDLHLTSLALEKQFIAFWKN